MIQRLLIENQESRISAKKLAVESANIKLQAVTDDIKEHNDTILAKENLITEKEKQLAVKK